MATAPIPRQPSSPTSKRNAFRRMIDPLPLSFSRRDISIDQSEADSDPPKPRRSLSFPSSSSSSPTGYSGLNGIGADGIMSSTAKEFAKDEDEKRYGGMGEVCENGLNASAAATAGTMPTVIAGDGDKLENGQPRATTNSRRTLSRDDNKEMSGKDWGRGDGTIRSGKGSKGGKDYVNGSKELMQGEEAVDGDENRPGYGIGGTGIKRFDRPRQLPTPALSPGGPAYSNQRRSSVAGPVTGLGVVLGNRSTPPLEIASSAPSPRGLSGVGGETSGRNERSRDVSPRLDQRKIRVRKLSSAKMHELTASPESTILRTVPSDTDNARKMSLSSIPLLSLRDEDAPEYSEACIDGSEIGSEDGRASTRQASLSKGSKNIGLDDVPEIPGSDKSPSGISSPREKPRTVSSTDASSRRRRSSVGSKSELPSQSSTMRSKSGRVPKKIDLENQGKNGHIGTPAPDPHPSPMPQSIPLPPLSVPTYLQLELSSNRPSPLYIHQSATNDFPYESSRAKIERLQNFLLLPPQLEQVLWFGALACLDAWLYSFTILPLRFFKALFILFQSWAINIGAEIQYVSGFVFEGVRRVWRRRQRRGSTLTVPADLKDGDEASRSRATSTVSSKQDNTHAEKDSRNRAVSGQHESGRRHHGSSSRKHRRNKSIPSALVPDDKADILKGLLMIVTCTILMYFDASRMYHWIRGQAAIKLYVIYNVLEVRLPFYPTIFRAETICRLPTGYSLPLDKMFLNVSFPGKLLNESLMAGVKSCVRFGCSSSRLHTPSSIRHLSSTKSLR